MDRDRLESVRGQMAFARRSPEERAPDVSFPRYEHVPMVSYGDIAIRNARPIASELSLDKEGFALVEHRTAWANERDAAILSEPYLDELVPFIKARFGASWVVPRRDGVIVRSAGASAAPNVRGTAGMAHIDYAPISAPMLAARENQKQGLPIRSYARLMIIQAWRAVSPPPQDVPLALCDRSTVLDSDMLVLDYVSDTGADWKSMLLRHNPRHRWYYFPDMTPDELILFKGYDSEARCNAQAAHTGFDNRRAQPRATPRVSIEARFYVYYA